MAELESGEGGKKKGGGWFKAVLGTLGGLLSGAVVMYFSAYLDKAVKPARPVPNFRVEHEGRTVHFHNLSPGFTGWWDFGDGSELIPADADHESIDHTYERPGDYTVKLSLSNLFGEDSNRTVALHVEDPPEIKQPKVLSLEAVRVSPGTGAPALFRVTAKTANAPLCIWDVSDERPLEAVTEETASQDRLLQFDKPGAYVIEMVAVNENLWDKKTMSVNVTEPPAGGVGVVLAWTDAGTQVKTQKVPCTFCDTFRPDVKGDRCPLSGRDLCAACSTDKCKDWVIRDVQVTGANGKPMSLGDRMEMALDPATLGLQSVQNLGLQLAPDRRSVRMVGDLVRPAGKTGGPAPSVVLQGVMTKELRKPDSRPVQVPATLVVPAASQTTTEVVTAPPAPADWVDVQPRKMRLTVSDGPTVLAQDVPVPGLTDLTLQKRHCTLVSRLIKDKDGKDQIHLDLIAAGKPN